MMFEWLWGLKTVALFDVWTIEHILSGLSVGSLVKEKNREELGRLLKKRSHRVVSLRFDLIGVLFAAYIWEALEHYLEVGLAGVRVEYWFQGVEMWGNRLITDPLMLVLGYWIVTRYPKLVWPARITSVLWLIVHIFVFPHSMYLHELF